MNTHYFKDPQCRNVGGIWYSPTMPEGRRYTERPPPNNPEDGPFCNGNHGTLAVTVREWGAIVFCKDVNISPYPLKF